MEEFGKRLETLINSIGITKTAFAEKISVSQAYVSQMCGNRKFPSDRTILDICRVYNVNEAWLRTGEGEMFREIDKNEELSAFLGDLLRDKPDFRYRLISVLARMTPEEWELLERKARELAAELAQDEKKDGP